MTHRANSNLLRLKYSRLWSSVWCNDQNYSKIVIEDIRIRVLVLEFYKTFSFEIVDFKISRTPSKIFLFLKGVTKTFENYWDTRRFLDIKTQHMSYAMELKKIIRSILGHSHTYVFYRLLFFGYPLVKEDIFTRSFFLGGAKKIADIIGSSFRRRFRKPHKKIFAVMSKIARRKNDLKDWKIIGFRFAISGPLKAPRNRRHKTLSKTYGTLPINSFNAYLDYYQTTICGIHGAFGLKIWVFRGYKSIIKSGHFRKKIIFSKLKKRGYYLYLEDSEKIYRQEYAIRD